MHAIHLVTVNVPDGSLPAGHPSDAARDCREWLAELKVIGTTRGLRGQARPTVEPRGHRSAPLHRPGNPAVSARWAKPVRTLVRGAGSRERVSSG